MVCLNSLLVTAILVMGWGALAVINLGHAGFPRDVAQAHYFEQKVCLIGGVLVLDCSEDTCTRRLLTRARFDDNYENIQRRLDTFANTTSKVIDLFRGREKLWSVNAEDEIEKVGWDFEQLFREISNRE